MEPAVHFPIYRQYTKARQSANNAMVSFLAGSALASHTLQLTTGSNRLLPEIFPAVPHITRFNLRPDAAADVLGAAGPHLATVTIPYALAIHEDFVTQCIRWIRDAFGFPPPRTVSSIRSWNEIVTSNMHEALVSMTGDALDQHGSVDLELFHLYRLMRNCHIHNGGNVTNALRRQVRSLSSGAQDRWRKLTRREADALVRGDRAEYSLLDVFSVFAVTKGLGRGVNALLQAASLRNTGPKLASMTTGRNPPEPATAKLGGVGSSVMLGIDTALSGCRSLICFGQPLTRELGSTPPSTRKRSPPSGCCVARTPTPGWQRVKMGALQLSYTPLRGPGLQPGSPILASDPVVLRGGLCVNRPRAITVPEPACETPRLLTTCNVSLDGQPTPLFVGSYAIRERTVADGPRAVTACA